jgi:hypothetical protein
MFLHNRARQSRQTTNASSTNASSANVVDFALPIRIGFESYLRSYIEYLEIQVAHFGDGIDFDYLRTIVLTIGDEGLVNRLDVNDSFGLYPR